MPVAAGVKECDVELVAADARDEVPRLIEGAPDDVESSDAGGLPQGDRRPAIGEELGRVPLPGGEASPHHRVGIARLPGLFDVGAPSEEQFEKVQLHAGLLRMDARRHEPERGRAPAIGIRGGIDVGASVEAASP